MEKARRQERAEHEAHVARNLAPGYAPKHKERLSKQLVLALRPKLMQRLRGPGTVHHGRPRARRVPESGDGKERHEVVDHAEPRDEADARQDVEGGRDEEARGRGQVREEDGAARGVADPGDQLDARVDDVEEQKADEEGPERRAEEGPAFLRPRGRGCVHALAKVPAEAAHGKHEFEGVLGPLREEGGALAFRVVRRAVVLLRRMRVAVGGDGRGPSRQGACAVLCPACAGLAWPGPSRCPYQ